MTYKSVIKLAVLVSIIFLAISPCADAANLLGDHNFEQSTPDGSFPDAGYWLTDWVGFGGAGCTTTAGRSGNGLWLYTGENSDHWWSGPYQDAGAQPGKIYFASAWVRAKFAGSEWVPGSRALVKVKFLDSSRNTLAEYESRPITDPNTNWSLLYFATHPAPLQTQYARFVLYTEKPQTEGQTIVNFDDCLLREYECSDCINLDFVPDCGSDNDLVGSAYSVDTNEYKVGVYIYVEDWWPKPTFTNPWTDINPDGTWQCDITTGGDDANATEILAFLVPTAEIASWPVDFNSPSGLAALPGEAFRFPSTGTFRPSCFTVIGFSGYNWLVKRTGSKKVGPGPNWFSDSEENVWVDSNGLHLRITEEDGKWTCAEVLTEEPFGYGTYVFEVQGDLNSLDPNVVLGLFIWDEFAPHYTNREMDIEITRWGKPENDNAQYVVQPWNGPNNLFRFNFPSNDSNTMTMVLDWQQESVYFNSFYGDFSIPPSERQVIESWTYEGNSVPQPGKENVRINLWLDEGSEPANGQEAEIVVKSFHFIPPPGVEVSCDSLDFGSVVIGRTAHKVLRVYNTGQDDLYVDSVQISGPDSANFYVSNSTFVLDSNSAFNFSNCSWVSSIVFLKETLSLEPPSVLM